MNPVGQTINLPGGIASGIAPGGSEYKTGAGMTKVTEARQINGQTYYNIDQRGLGGGTGWIAASALGGGAPAAAPTPTPTAAPVAPTSGGSGFSAPQAPPVFDLIGATNAAFNSPEIQAANKAIADRQKALATASAGINDNPFYAEATRVGKQAMLTDRANADIGVQQNILAGLKADAQIKLNAAQGQYNINRQAYQDTLTQFNHLLTAGALTNASPQDLATYSVATGIPVSILQGIQAKEQNDSIKTQVITGNDGTISIIDTKTGKIISRTQPGVGEVKKVTGTGTATKAPDTNKYLTQATKYLSSADIAVTGKGTSDKLLSKEEAAQAYQQILALVGGSQETADAVFNQAMNAGGYGKYGNW